MYDLLSKIWSGYSGAIVYTFIVTQVTIACVTLYLHRGEAHGALKFTPWLAHIMRAWLWMTTGMVTREWVAVHRKHHSSVDADGDPHSPWSSGNSIWSIFPFGVIQYVKAVRDKSMIEQFGHNTPNDWVETEVYSKYPAGGIVIMLCINMYFFGIAGAAIWLIQMAWIPFWAAGVINGLGHYLGYQNYHDSDPDRPRNIHGRVHPQIVHSTNILPLGIWIGGEELHNNHHAFATSAKFSRKWYEFDIGWMYIRILKAFGLCKLRRDE